VLAQVDVMGSMPGIIKPKSLKPDGCSIICVSPTTNVISAPLSATSVIKGVSTTGVGNILNNVPGTPIRAACSAAIVKDVKTLGESASKPLHAAPSIEFAAGSSQTRTSFGNRGEISAWGPPGTTRACQGVGAFVIASKVPVGAEPTYAYAALLLETSSVGL
jgi:hypothetical protein